MAEKSCWTRSPIRPNAVELEIRDVTVRIKYCGPCGYRPHAERLAKLIHDRFGHEVQLDRGSFGVFKIWLGERLVFDKRTTGGLLGKLGFGRIPPDQQILDRIASSRA